MLGLATSRQDVTKVAEFIKMKPETERKMNFEIRFRNEKREMRDS